MIFAILGVVFLLVLILVPIYFFWVRDKANDEEQKDTDQNAS